MFTIDEVRVVILITKTLKTMKISPFPTYFYS